MTNGFKTEKLLQKVLSKISCLILINLSALIFEVFLSLRLNDHIYVNVSALQYAKFNSVPIDPTSECNYKNQGTPTKHKENEKNESSVQNTNGTSTNDLKNNRYGKMLQQSTYNSRSLFLNLKHIR